MIASAPASEIARWRWTRWLPLATAVGLALAAALLRTCECEAEGDLYHQRAERLLAGAAVFDRFHPFGYVLLVAVVHTIVGNSLLAGAFVSAAAAGVLVWSTGELAEALRPGAGGPTRLLTASNAVVWTLGTMACSDMTAAALGAWALALSWRSPAVSGRCALGIGFLLGFAVGTRFASAAMLVWVAAAALLQSPRWGTALAVAGGIALGLVPQGVLSTIAVGAPFQNDNWHNLVLKVVCHGDLEQMQRMYDSGTFPTAIGFLREHWTQLLALGLRDTWTALTQVLPSMVLGSLSTMAWLAIWPLLLAAAGLLLAARATAKGFALAMLALLLAASVCVTLAPRGRQLLGVLPCLLPGLGVLVAALDGRCLMRRALLAGSWFVMLGISLTQFGDYLASQPTREIEVARQLPRLVAHPYVLMTTNASMHRYVTCTTWGLLAAPFASSELAWTGLGERMRRCGADLLLTSRQSNPHLHAQLVAGEAPAGFQRLVADDEVVLVECRTAPSDWFESFAVTPTKLGSGDRLDLELTLSPAADLAVVKAVGALLRDPTGRHELLVFQPVAERRYRHHLLAPETAGVHLVEPFALRIAAPVLRGTAAEFLVTKR